MRAVKRLRNYFNFGMDLSTYMNPRSVTVGPAFIGSAAGVLASERTTAKKEAQGRERGRPYAHLEQLAFRTPSAMVSQTWYMKRRATWPADHATVLVSTTAPVDYRFGWVLAEARYSNAWSSRSFVTVWPTLAERMRYGHFNRPRSCPSARASWRAASRVP
jgi:hypothetical protein